MDRAPALAQIAPRLRCPNCGASLAAAERTLVCASGHSFDVARQGHVALLPPRSRAAQGDTAGMVAAREAFLGAGHYAPVAAAINAAAEEVAPTAGPRCAVDIGAGTGHYLSALLDRLPDWHGIALDASRPALQRAARAHPHMAAVGCDVWQELPVQDAAAGLVIDVFAPRNGEEIARVLAPDGALIVVTPTPDHLRELAPLGILSVDERKDERVRAALAPHLTLTRSTAVTLALTLGHDDVRALVAMGPSAHHVGADELRERVAGLPAEVQVTGSVNVETFRRA